MASKAKKLPKKHQQWFDVDAVQAGDMSLVKAMLAGANKIPIDTERPDGRTALIMASGNHDHKMVEVLLESGASLNSKSHTGHNALRAVITPDWGGQHNVKAESSWEDTILKLLQHGAKLDQQMIYGILQNWDSNQIDWLLRNYRSAITFETASKAIAAAKPDVHERQVDESTFKDNIRILLDHIKSS